MMVNAVTTIKDENSETRLARKLNVLCFCTGNPWILDKRIVAGMGEETVPVHQPLSVFSPIQDSLFSCFRPIG